jgi:OFA family oxalate/formate antiporter-like MFS transporter
MLYLVAVLVTFGGLLVTAQLRPMAVAAGLDRVSVLGGMDTLALALVANLAVGVVARPFWGWLSDRVGRSSTMVAAFSLGGLAIMGLIYGLRSPFWFVAMSSLTIFAWGASFVLFSAAVGDAFGSDYAATNTGIQYTSKGVAAICAGWGAARLLELTDSWTPVLWLAAGCNLVAAALVLLSLGPAIARLTADRLERVAPRRPAHSEGHGD